MKQVSKNSKSALLPKAQCSTVLQTKIILQKKHVSIVWTTGHAEVYGSTVADYILIAKSGTELEIDGILKVFANVSPVHT